MHLLCITLLTIEMHPMRDLGKSLMQNTLSCPLGSHEYSHLKLQSRAHIVIVREICARIDFGRRCVEY